MSNPHRPSDPSGTQCPTTKNYDWLSRVITVQTCDLATTSSFYQNNQTVVTDPASISKWSQTDGLGRLTYVIEGQASFLTTAPSLIDAIPDVIHLLCGRQSHKCSPERKLDQRRNGTSGPAVQLRLAKPAHKCLQPLERDHLVYGVR